MAKDDTGGGFLGAVWETVKTIFWALLIAGLFRTVFYQPFWIPSGSMKDTLLIGDFLFVNKMKYGWSYASCPSIRLARFGIDIDIDAKDICGFLDGDNTRIWGEEPDRGDVVVFRHPATGQDYIKRLVGMPGDTIQMVRGVLHINGEPVQLEDAGTFVETWERQGPEGRPPRCENGAVGQGAECIKSRQIETLPGGTSHSILNIGDYRGADDTGVFTVPEKHYFLMGDNRDNSLDSRFAVTADGVGFVPYENLIGRADRIMFSSAGRSMLFFWTWRGDRFFKSVD